jgi:hypothetical protein
VQNRETMALTELQKQNIRKLSTEDKIEILHECADEFMTADEYHDITKMPKRTIYAKFGTPEVKGFEFCGHKLFYF